MTILCGSLGEFLQEVPGPRDLGEPVYVCGWCAPHETTTTVYGIWTIATARRSASEVVEWRQMIGAPMNRTDRERAEFILAEHFDECRKQLVETYGRRVALNRRILDIPQTGYMIHLAEVQEETNARTLVH